MGAGRAGEGGGGRRADDGCGTQGGQPGVPASEGRSLGADARHEAHTLWPPLHPAQLPPPPYHPPTHPPVELM